MITRILRIDARVGSSIVDEWNAGKVSWRMVANEWAHRFRSSVLRRWYADWNNLIERLPSSLSHHRRFAVEYATAPNKAITVYLR